MLATAGLLTILAVLAAIVSRRMSAFAALAVIPVLAAFAIGQGGQLGAMIMAGFATVAPTAAMFLFAILFFSILAPLAWKFGVAGAALAFVIATATNTAIMVFMLMAAYRLSRATR